MNGARDSAISSKSDLQSNASPAARPSNCPRHPAFRPRRWPRPCSPKDLRLLLPTRNRADLQGAAKPRVRSAWLAMRMIPFFGAVPRGGNSRQTGSHLCHQEACDLHRSCMRAYPSWSNTERVSSNWCQRRPALSLPPAGNQPS